MVTLFFSIVILSFLILILVGCGRGFDGEFNIPCVQGDVNYDGVVNKSDLIIAGEANVWLIHGRKPKMDDKCQALDCNTSGEFSVEDVYCIEDIINE